jgi:hypothetical protein
MSETACDVRPKNEKACEKLPFPKNQQCVWEEDKTCQAYIITGKPQESTTKKNRVTRVLGETKHHTVKGPMTLVGEDEEEEGMSVSAPPKKPSRLSAISKFFLKKGRKGGKRSQKKKKKNSKGKKKKSTRRRNKKN